MEGGHLGLQPVDLGQAGVGLVTGVPEASEALVELGLEVRVGAVEGRP